MNVTKVLRTLVEVVREAARRVWLLRVRYGPRVDLPGAPPVAVVVLSYAREQNIDGILRAAARCSFVRHIVLSNNNPDSRIRDHVSLDDPRLEIIEQTERKRPGVRWSIARDQLDDAEIVLCIDDDVFLFPRQIKRLVQLSMEDPSSVHGVAGMVEGRYVKNEERVVDHVVRVYTVRRAHVRRYFELIDQMGATEAEVDRVGDDIVVSLAGQGPPRSHDLGFVLSCKTSLAEGIAVNQESGFDDARRLLLADARRARAELS